MYIEPNIAFLKKATIVSTILLIMVFGLFFVFSKNIDLNKKSVQTVGVSGILQKEDGVFSVQGQIVLAKESIDGYVGKSVAIVGTMGDEGVLLIEQLIAAPIIEEPKKEINGKIFSADSKFAFAARIPYEWQFEDKSSEDMARVFLTQPHSDIRIELIRKDNAENTFIPFEYAEVDSKEILINGFSYLMKRAIPENTNYLADVIEPNEVCLIDKSCPKFYGFSEKSTAITVEALKQVIQTLVFAPEPESWKLLKHSLNDSNWDFYVYYPDDIEIFKDKKRYLFDVNDKTIMSLEVVDEYIFDSLKDAKSKIITLPTRDEKMYQTSINNQIQNLMILRTPDDKFDVVISGFGNEFNAIIRTFVFTKK